jgi:hypothetical protein
MLETIPDREILSACLDLLLAIASNQRGEAVTVNLMTDKGTTIRVISTIWSSDALYHPELVLEKQGNSGGLLAQ